MYSFTTESKVGYELVFSSDADYLTDYPFSDSVFTFSIEHVSGNVGARDLKVGLTIAHALNLVFAEADNLVITYICSNAEDQGPLRSRLFEQWYNKHGQGFTQLKHTDRKQINSAAIFKENHPHALSIEEAFDGIYKDK